MMRHHTHKFWAKFFISCSLFFWCSIAYTQALAYCDSQGNSVSYEWINSIQIGSFLNNSGMNGGYANFSANPINLSNGATNIVLTPGFRYGSYNEYWKLWIDLNQDGSFSNEEVLYSGSSRGTINAAITLPNATLPGYTGLRISMRYGGTPPACGTFTYGEVEDYTVSITSNDTTPPQISSVTPNNNATKVSSNTTIVATFSEAIDAASVMPDALVVLDGVTQVEGTLGHSSNSITFTPSYELTGNTLYTALVKANIRDLAGNYMVEDYVWSFTTETVADLTPPQIIDTNPMANDVNVAVSSAISATFSEPVDPATLTAATFSIQAGLEAIAGSINVNDTEVTFTPTQPLAYDTNYTAIITTGIQDLAGNSLGNDYTWQFTTGAAPDTTPPVVSTTDPQDLATGIAVDAAVSVTFSEAMNAGTLTTATFTLSDGWNYVAGTVSASGTSATFKPNEPLQYDTLYTATVSTGATDLSGNGLASDVQWSFSTMDSQSISGQVIFNAQGLDGATVSLSGDPSSSQVTDINGYYSFDSLAPGTYNLTPSLIGYTFEPESISVEITDNDVTDINFNATFISYIYVPGDYGTIQQAVDAAGNGATILVADGVYNENIDINKPLTIQSENGYEFTTVVASKYYDHVFQISAPDVTIKGFDIYGATGYYRSAIYFGAGSDNGKSINNRCGYDSTHSNYIGVYIYHSDNNQITDNTCTVSGLYGILANTTNGSSITGSAFATSGFEAIYLTNSSNNTISGNTANNSRYGIRLSNADNNKISGNDCSSNSNDGIYLDSTSDNIVTQNSCSSNGSTGILLEDSTGNLLTGNSALNNAVSGIVAYSSNNTVISGSTCSGNHDYGLYINNSDYSTVTNNTCNSNHNTGIKLNYADNNTIAGNTANYNYYRGIEVYQSTLNLFTGNTANSNKYLTNGCGIEIRYANGNTVYLNQFTNNVKADVCAQSSTNSWSSPTEIAYTYNGSDYLGYLGNYYSDHVLTDSDGDGITDTAFDLPADELDDPYPLAAPIDSYIIQ